MAANEALVLDGLPLNGSGGPGYTNLVTNPSFEVNTAGWRAGTGNYWLNIGGTVGRYAGTSGVGSFYGFISVAGDLANQGIESDVTGPFVAGITYTASLLLYGYAGKARNVYFGHISSDSAIVIASHIGWERVSVTWTPTTTRATASFGVRTMAAVADGIDIDGAMITTAPAPAYFDGDTAGSYWTGTAHNSSSSSSPLMLESVDFPPPPRLAEWIRGSDSDGSILARQALSDNREITCRVRIGQQATMDLALAKIGAVVDKLQEAERNPGGIDLTWTPAGATKSITFKCLSGEVTDLPVDVESGWFVQSPVITVKMTCLPFGYGAEVVGVAPVSSTLPVMTVELTGVPGDVPAEARLIVTDNASRSRRLVRWGLESRFYATSSPPSLILDSDSLVTTGFAGTQVAITGAYDPNATGNNAIRAALATQPVPVCGTGNQTHVGSFRVFARVFSYFGTGAAQYLRLAWQDGDGPLRANPYVTPLASSFSEVDLGLITVSEKTLGTQRWTGRIEAYSTLAGETFDLDYLYLIPVEGYGEARGTYAYQPGAIAARDEFASTTAGAALNARVAPMGGTWATSGAPTDLTFADVPSPYETASRATAIADTGDGRLAVLGTTSYTDTDASVLFQATNLLDSTALHQGLIIRYVDASNYLLVAARMSDKGVRLILRKRVAGSLSQIFVTTLGGLTGPAVSANTWYRLRAVCYASGVIRTTLLSAAGAIVADGMYSDPQLATGGVLATGKTGFFDFLLTAITTTRYYTNFYTGTPAAEPIAVYPSQSIEFRHDAALREDSSGVYWGQPPSYRGSRFTVPPAGTRGRKSRVAVVARRNDVIVNADDQIADSTTVQVNYTSRHLVIPR